MNTNKVRMVLGIALAVCLALMFLWFASGPQTASAQTGAGPDTPTPTGMPTQTPVMVTETPNAAAPTWTPYYQHMPYGWNAATQTPVMVTQTPSSDSNVSRLCLGDKIATVNELNAAGPQRMEISTGDIIHLDYYQDSGKPAVSVLVRKGEVAVLKGYGSEWQFPLRDCATYDFVKDATEYAKGRQMWNHSGLVFNSLKGWLDGNEPIVNLYHVDYRLPQYRPVLWENKTTSSALSTTPAPNMTPIAVATTAAPASQCSDGDRTDYSAVVGTAIRPNPDDDWVIVNFWTNEPGHVQGERKLLLGPNDDVQLYGGGASWVWASDCGDKAKEEFSKNPLTEVTLTELDNEGLVLH